MKKRAASTALLALIFVAGFAGARLASPSPPVEALPDSSGDEKDRRLSALPGDEKKPAVHRRTGLAGALAYLESVEAVMRAGDFEDRMTAEEAYSSAIEWVKNDPEGLWKWIEKNGSDRFGSNIYGHIFSHWFPRDPEAAIDALRRTGDSGRWEGIQALLGMMYHDDPEVARAAAEGLGDFFGPFRPDPREPHGRQDFSKGLESIEGLRALPRSHIRDSLIGGAFATWVYKDWNAAITWFDGQPEEARAELAPFLFHFGFTGSFRTSPEATAWAVAWLEREENRDERMLYGSDVAYAMARHDPVAAMQWAGENLGGAPLSKAVARIVSAQYGKDPATAIEFVDAIPPGGTRLLAGRALVTGMRKKDPMAAFERALHDRELGFDATSNQWRYLGLDLAKNEPETTRDILADWPDDHSRSFEDYALDGLIRNDPAATMEWAESLGGERGEKLAARLLRNWFSRDRKAALQWETNRGQN